MTREDFKQIEEHYVTIKKGVLWQFAGGLAGVLIAVSLISYEAAKNAISSAEGTNTLKLLRKDAAEGGEILAAVKAMQANAVKDAGDLQKLIDQRVAMGLQSVKLNERLSAADDAIKGFARSQKRQQLANEVARLEDEQKTTTDLIASIKALASPYGLGPRATQLNTDYESRLQMINADLKKAREDLKHAD